MLRVYAAAHGLTSDQHAVVEIGSDEIVFRVDARWTRFTRNTMTASTGSALPFAMLEDGTVQIGDRAEEMDIAAEQVAREMMQNR